MVVYDDTKRNEKLKLATDILKAQKDAIQNIIADPDMDFDQILELVSVLKSQRQVTKGLKNELDRFFQPFEAAPP